MVFFPNIVVHKIMVQFIISNVLDLMKCGNICLINLLVVVRTKSDMFARTLHLCEQTRKQKHLCPWIIFLLWVFVMMKLNLYVS